MMGLGGAPDDVLDPASPHSPVRFTGLSRGRHEGELLYSLESGVVTGVFYFTEGEELRLFHGADVRVHDVVCRSDGSKIACAVSTGSAQNIAIMEGDGSELVVLTEGDSVDSSPSWVPGTSRTLVARRATLRAPRPAHHTTGGFCATA